MIDRRDFLRLTSAAVVTGIVPDVFDNLALAKDDPLPPPPEENSVVWVSHHTDVGQNTAQLLHLLGGIESLVGPEDIVILKVNSQWWHQGMTHTDFLFHFISAILNRPGFSGEIILADNHQARVPNSRGWTTRKRNGRFNYNELVAYFKQEGYPNVTKYHWHPAGPNPTPLQFGGSGNSVVSHPEEGDGYVWPEHLFYESPHGNRTLLSYPIFTSAYSGITIDLKNGAYEHGQYSSRPVKFFNVSAINHHSAYAGVTASVKNLMGVVDMSCGYPAPLPPNTYNTHHVGATPLFKWMARYKKELDALPGFHRLYLHPEVFRFRYTGGVLGKWMAEIRKPDLNIITAISVGWGSRTDTRKAAHPNVLTASTDPVALDYWTAKYVLYPATRRAGAPKKLQNLNNPDTVNGPFRRFLTETARELGGALDEQFIEVRGENHEFLYRQS